MYNISYLVGEQVTAIMAENNFAIKFNSEAADFAFIPFEGTVSINHSFQSDDYHSFAEGTKLLSASVENVYHPAASPEVAYESTFVLKFSSLDYVVVTLLSEKFHYFSYSGETPEIAEAMRRW